MSTTTLESIRTKAQRKLPNIGIEDNAYCIGYWAAAAELKKPNDIEDDDFYRGWDKRVSERGNPS